MGTKDILFRKWPAANGLDNFEDRTISPYVDLGVFFTQEEFCRHYLCTQSGNFVYFFTIESKWFYTQKKSGVTVHVSLVSTCSSWSVETFLGFMSCHSDDLSFLSMIGFIRTVFYSILLCDLFLLVFLSELSHQQTCRFSWFFFFLCSLFKCKTVVTLFDPKSSCQVVCFCFFSIIRPQFFHTL